MAKKRRKIETNTALVPLSVYQNEIACRAWIAWLERQLKSAKRTLRLILYKM